MINKAKKEPEIQRFISKTLYFRLLFKTADNRTRTCTGEPTAPKTVASANSAISALLRYISIYLLYCQYETPNSKINFITQQSIPWNGATTTTRHTMLPRTSLVSYRKHGKEIIRGMPSAKNPQFYFFNIFFL